jgi:CBS-domain-containing membrane protein
MDWLAADLPFEGTAQLAGAFTRRGVAAAGEGTSVAQARRLREAHGFGPVVVVNHAQVVMGAAYRRDLAAAAQATVGAVMRFGVSTVRPSEDAAALAHRMGHAGVTRVVVTRSDGTLVGLFFSADAPS